MTSRVSTVLLAGATGLVGRHCLELLTADTAFRRVVVLTRRPLPADLPGADDPKVEERVIDFDRLTDPRRLSHPDPPSLDRVPRVDQVICALGTTLRRAGSKERFHQVDFGYPAALARMAVERGARHFLLVSAIGADAASRIFYNRVKGELEEAVSALPYRSVTIVRPSLLLGDREDFRLGEELAKRLSFLAPRRYRPVHALRVAAALVQAAKDDEPGRRIIESAGIPPLDVHKEP